MYRINKYQLLGLIFLFLFACKKESDSPTGSNKIEIGTTTTDTISYFFAQVSTKLILTGGNQITQHGHCWSLTENPTIEDNKTNLGSISSPKSFSSELQNMEPNTVYYIRAYATFSGGTIYNGESQIKTLKTGLPVVQTGILSDPTITGITCNGVALADSGLTIIQKGFCWSQDQYPSLSNNIDHSENGDSLGAFDYNITGLEEGNQYYVVAYATNDKGISYGEIKTFQTVPITIPTVITSEATSITINSASCGGDVTDAGNGTVTVRGVCWSTQPNPTLENNSGYTSDGSGIGSFSSSLTGLGEGTTYYVVAYATNEKGTDYGEVKSFQTFPLLLPEVITSEVSEITINSAICGGEVTDTGNGTVTARGVCWDTQPNPTLENNVGYSVDGSGAGSFVSNISGLIEGTTYYTVGYATNEKGTSYGDVKIFQTIPITLPVVITSEVSDITLSSAICGGDVTDAGNGIVTARGACWDTQPNPTLDNNVGYIVNGNGIGPFISNITGLLDGTTYYITAYATNEKGTSYGAIRSFMTLIDYCEGISIINYGGQTYHTIAIGQQCWMKENMNIGSRIDGSQEQTDNSTIEKYCYDDNEANCDTYGGLYQWNEMMQYITQQGVQGICPQGWHIPTDGEWTILTDCLGGYYVAGGEMKETGYIHWSHPNTGATNSSDFTALPGGNRSDSGSFGGLGYYANLWASTENSTTSAFMRWLYHNFDDADPGTFPKELGISVRCLKDE